MAAGVTGSASFGYAWRLEPHWIEIVRREMPVKNLPKALDGKRLIQISDLHVGPVVDDDYLIDAMKIVNELKPDILAFTGDLVSYQNSRQFAQSANVLSFLESPTIAKVAILGNHDYGRRFSDPYVADGIHKVLDRAGFTVLRNQGLDVLSGESADTRQQSELPIRTITPRVRNSSTDVAGLRVIGVDDFWSPNCDLDQSFGGYDSARANLVLCHNPDALDHEGWNGYDGWVLSGHTHGGQCRLPGLTPPILPIKNKRYASGAVSLLDGRKVYVNRGLGYLARLRFCARPEITVFTLRVG
jgi:predicted MPP superfamily phosphohydrolase